MNRSSRLALAALLTSAALGACRRQPDPVPAPPSPPPVNQDSIDAARRAQEAAAAAARARQDSINAANARAAEEAARIAREAAAAAAAVAEARRLISAVIYFDYDQAEITADSRATLDAKLPVLNANPGMRLRIAGHTDSRGSDEYNLALGQRRAAAAKRYLTGRGIADTRIDIQSFGEDRPVAMGTDEGAYAQNRRDEFEITAGGDNITVPR
jgi:peptidoglycan-associated lipoprotein